MKIFSAFKFGAIALYFAPKISEKLMAMYDRALWLLTCLVDILMLAFVFFISKIWGKDG